MEAADQAAAEHVPVLPQQCLDVMKPQAGQVVMDCTLGRGGHASLIAPLLGATGCYIGFDVDPESIAFCQARLSKCSKCRLELIRANFHTAPHHLQRLGLLTPASSGASSASPAHLGVDSLLADLGYSSKQLADAARGLSFLQPGPLDMRLDPDRPKSAADLVNTLSEEELANIIFTFGEEKLSRKIARLVVEAREFEPITTTNGLADVVRRAYGRKAAAQLRIDPATKTFQALRIAVNGELDVLQRLLEEIPRLVRPGGVAAIISFHSLEDRLVKQAFAALVKSGRATPVTRKPLVADARELAANPRSRSAKLRAIRMVDPTEENREDDDDEDEDDDDDDDDDHDGDGSESEKEPASLTKEAEDNAGEGKSSHDDNDQDAGTGGESEDEEEENGLNGPSMGLPTRGRGGHRGGRGTARGCGRGPRGGGSRGAGARGRGRGRH